MLDWQWPAALVYTVTFLVLGALVYSGKLHPEVLVSCLTWLAPAPWRAKPGAPAGSITTTSTTQMVAPAPKEPS